MNHFILSIDSSLEEVANSTASNEDLEDNGESFEKRPRLSSPINDF